MGQGVGGGSGWLNKGWSGVGGNRAKWGVGAKLHTDTHTLTHTDTHEVFRIFPRRGQPKNTQSYTLTLPEIPTILTIFNIFSFLELFASEIPELIELSLRRPRQHSTNICKLAIDL